MPKGSMVTLGGGWKQFYAEKADKQTFYALVKEVLGVEKTNVIEFFGAVEHPILYTDCRCHHFHIPVAATALTVTPPAGARDTPTPTPEPPAIPAAIPGAITAR